MAFGGERAARDVHEYRNGPAPDRSATFPGMTFAPRFAPGGRSASSCRWPHGASTNLYTMSIGGGGSDPTRLTDTQAIDTAPSYSPDGAQICLRIRSWRHSTDLRDERPAAAGAKRISFGDGRYSTPVWSPKGDFIAFTKQGKGDVLDRRHEAGRVRRAAS